MLPQTIQGCIDTCTGNTRQYWLWFTTFIMLALPVPPAKQDWVQELGCGAGYLGKNNISRNCYNLILPTFSSLNQLKFNLSSKQGKTCCEAILCSGQCRQTEPVIQKTWHRVFQRNPWKTADSIIRGKQGNTNPDIKSGIVCYFFYFTRVYMQFWLFWTADTQIFLKFPIYISQNYTTLWTLSFSYFHHLLLNAVLKITSIL